MHRCSLVAIILNVYNLCTLNVILRKILFHYWCPVIANHLIYSIIYTPESCIAVKLLTGQTAKMVHDCMGMIVVLLSVALILLYC